MQTATPPHDASPPSQPAAEPWEGHAWEAARRRGGSKLMRAFNSVPADELRSFSRTWNRACAVLTAVGLGLVALALYG